MNVIDLLKKVYRRIEGDVDYPEFEDEDMQLYFAFLLDSYDSWLERFPNDTLTKPTVEGDEITTIRPDYCYYFILYQMYLEDDVALAKKFEDQMKDQERLEKVARHVDANSGDRLNVTGLPTVGHGAGFGELDSEIV